MTNFMANSLLLFLYQSLEYVGICIMPPEPNLVSSEIHGKFAIDCSYTGFFSKCFTLLYNVFHPKRFFKVYLQVMNLPLTFFEGFCPSMNFRISLDLYKMYVCACVHQKLFYNRFYPLFKFNTADFNRAKPYHVKL